MHERKWRDDPKLNLSSRIENLVNSGSRLATLTTTDNTSLLFPDFQVTSDLSFVNEFIQSTDKELVYEIEDIWRQSTNSHDVPWNEIIILSPEPVLGKNVEISSSRPPEVGMFVRIDSSRIAPQAFIEPFNHIAYGVIIGGGSQETGFYMGPHSGLGKGSAIYTVSDDPMVNPYCAYPSPLSELVPEGLKGDVILEGYNGVGINSIVLPGTTLKRGAFVLGQSQVPPGSILEEWTVYGGVKKKEFGPKLERNADSIIAQTQRLERLSDLSFQLQEKYKQFLASLR